MSESSVFEFVSDQLQSRSTLDRLQARGTLRLALKGAGLESSAVTRDQMVVVLDRVLPDELSARGVDGAGELSAEIRDLLPAAAPGADKDAPEAVFARLAG